MLPLGFPVRNFGPLVVLASSALCAPLYLNYWVTLRLSPLLKRVSRCSHILSLVLRTCDC